MTSIPQRIGNYVLDREIGRGATSEVWLARHAHLEQRQVAVKILMAQDRETIQRFNREANLASRLNHPNIVHFYDHGYNGSFYYTVYEYVHGGSLRNLLDRQKRLPPADALAVFKQIAAALDYAHSLNIIHRDVSPGNVLVEQQSGRALLTDFGIARDADRNITIVNAVMGTPGYWSPEQAQSATLVSHLSDIYSLGVLFYMMLSGELPWDEIPGPPDHVFDPPLPLKQRGVDNLPGDIDRVLRTLLNTDPSKRFPSARAAVEELERIFVRHQMTTQINGQAPAKPRPAGSPTDPATGAGFALLASGVEQNAVETVLGPDLVRTPIAQAHQRAEDLRKPAVIADLLNAWSRQRSFPPRRTLLGRLARLHKVTSRNVYFFRVQVLCERREAPQELEEPDRQAQVFPLEPEVDRWQVPLPPPQEFKDDPGGQFVLPGSTRVVSCRSCGGKGATVCPRCKGKQRIYVANPAEPSASQRPAARGAVAASVAGAPAAESAASGVATHPPPAQVLVPCPACEGRGGLTCERCDGVGRLIQRKAFQWKRVVRDFADNDDLPDLDEAKLSRTCAMREIYRERASNGFRPEWALVPTLRELIAAAQSFADDNTRIVLSEVVVSFIPVTDIVFDLGKSDGQADDTGLYKLAIYGFENFIPPDWRFLNWERMIFICVLVFMAALLVVFAFFAVTAP